jgi:dipeptidyl-peptidase-4
VDTQTGQSRMLVDSERLGTGAALSERRMMRRERARLSASAGSSATTGRRRPLDPGAAATATSTSPPRRHHRRLTETEATELDARVSETGRFVSFVRDQNLYVIDAAAGPSGG